MFISEQSNLLRLGIFCVDESHLMDEWGADFRKAYRQIDMVVPHLPVWTSILGLTASLEPGRQTETVISSLGVRKDSFHLDRRDCERHNIDIIVRSIEHSSIFIAAIEVNKTSHSLGINEAKNKIRREPA